MNYSSINGFSALLSMYFKCALIVSLMIIRICLNGSNDALTWGSDQGSVSVPDQDDDGDQGEDDAEAGDADGKDCKHWPMPHILNLEKEEKYRMFVSDKNIDSARDCSSCDQSYYSFILSDDKILHSAHISQTGNIRLKPVSCSHQTREQQYRDWDQSIIDQHTRPDQTRLGYLWIINLL